jgi:transcriptional regulator with XRE-family HTH domain
MVMKKDISPEHQKTLIEVGKKVKQLRTAKNISYEQMAKEIGISRNTYNMLEHGKLSFQFSTLLLILKYHGISLSKFFKTL